MGRLPRFKDHRFVGTRDDMRVYDCDDPEQFALLETVADHDDNGIQTFGPDTAEEARNRGFRPVRGVGSG